MQLKELYKSVIRIFSLFFLLLFIYDIISNGLHFLSNGHYNYYSYIRYSIPLVGVVTFVMFIIKSDSLLKLLKLDKETTELNYLNLSKPISIGTVLVALLFVFKTSMSLIRLFRISGYTSSDLRDDWLFNWLGLTIGVLLIIYRKRIASILKPKKTLGN